jgi:hypothetical protein
MTHLNRNALHAATLLVSLVVAGPVSAWVHASGGYHGSSLWQHELRCGIEYPYRRLRRHNDEDGIRFRHDQPEWFEIIFRLGADYLYGSRRSVGEHE